MGQFFALGGMPGAVNDKVVADLTNRIGNAAGRVIGCEERADCARGMESSVLAGDGGGTGSPLAGAVQGSTDGHNHAAIMLCFPVLGGQGESRRAGGRVWQDAPSP